MAYDRREKKFKAQAQDGGKRLTLGYFDTAEDAATVYARSEAVPPLGGGRTEAYPEGPALSFA